MWVLLSKDRFRTIADNQPRTRLLKMRWALLLCIFMTGCARPADVFEVEIGDAKVAAATLSVCGQTTPLHRRAATLVGSRVITCEGSGVIDVRTATGGHVRCNLGYVTVQTGGDGFTHRFKLRGEACLGSYSIPAREEGGVYLSEKAANECGLTQVRKHLRPSGEVELEYYPDEQTPNAAQCIERWTEQQLNG